MPELQIAIDLDKKFPCPIGARNAVTEWRSNKLCSMRHRKDVPIYHCDYIDGLCSIEPYQSGQPETACKRCNVFWKTDNLQMQKAGVKRPVLNNVQVSLQRCKCGRIYEGTDEYKGCGITRCINPDFANKD